MANTSVLQLQLNIRQSHIPSIWTANHIQDDRDQMIASGQAGLYKKPGEAVTDMSKKRGQCRHKPAQDSSTIDDTLHTAHTAAAAAGLQVTGQHLSALCGTTPLALLHCCSRHSFAATDWTHTLRATALHCTQQRQAVPHDTTSCREPTCGRNSSNQQIPHMVRPCCPSHQASKFLTWDAAIMLCCLLATRQ